MPKRKATPSFKEDSPVSDLSSLPDDLSEANDEKIVEASRKKRKTAAPKVQRKTAKAQGQQNVHDVVKTQTTEVVVKHENDIEDQRTVTSKKKQSRTTRGQEVSVHSEAEVANITKPTRKRQIKEEKEAAAMPLAGRTLGHKLLVGAHVSSAGGVHNAITNSVHIGGNAFALFLKSQRKWSNPALIPDHCTSFHANCKQHAYDQGKHVVPHGSYLVNLAHTDRARTEQAYESYLDDLKRCDQLRIRLYNIHPGNTVSNDRATAIAHLASNINRAHKETKQVITLLENMAAGGNVLGSTFEDLRDIIALVEEKERIGVCIDTCHAFAAGYDLRTPAAFSATMDLFEKVVGFKYLRAMHINDSKAPFDSRRDLHANIGTGFLGLRAFHSVVNESRVQGIPLVLETPIDVTDEDGQPVKDEKGKQKEDKGIWAREIKLLESMVGMDVHGAEFQRLEKELARKGEPERKRLAEQMQRKKEKEAKKVKTGRKKGKQEVSEDEDEDEVE